MLEFKKILVPVDMSDFSLKALEEAISLAKKCDASITILNVLGDSFYTSNYIRILELEDITASVTRQMDEQLQQLAQKYASSGVAIDAVLKQGNASQVICDFARDGNYDLIVIATHGYSGLNSILIGSVTEKVVRMATCPVLTLRIENN
ncbi:UspA domain-containing protein [Desulfurispirillum indicum S5]|uniref:Universal stress protein n=1 Tax=Desulfurispirillum indicum (strain ATCC BAA-1389 / DSM 22839 / S5) TaxID=653733 RepID=E6W7C7_DESIS|nr:universal stress protein [Desulfurispirillum indicum]ADU66294.1 UspA domain-containing protein [Desulfurispirillum indicum S5]